MPLSVTCGCGHKFRTDDNFAGKEGPCPACGQTIKLEGNRVPPFDVFLSYSSKDKTIADAAVAVLEQRGLRCWVAPRNIVAGKEWGESIIEGIEQSGMVVLVFSQHSNQSQQVVREVERAVAKGIPIIPFRIEDIPASKAMEYFISCHHWLDAFNPPLEQHLSKLADMVGQLLGNAPPPKTAADDAKGVAGKLNAAVNTLLARDKRTQVLIGLAALVVVAALIVGASVFALRDPIASAEVIRAKAQAEVLAKQVQQINPAEGFAEKIEAIDQEFNTAATLFADKQFGKSLAAYQKVLAEGQGVVELDKMRRAADEQRTRMTRVQIGGPFQSEQFAKADWAKAKASADLARDCYARADFVNASKHWNRSAAEYTAAASAQAAEQAAAAKAAKTAGLPRLKAIAFWTSVSVGNKLWYETVRPPPAAAGADLGAFGGLPPPMAPGVRSFSGGLTGRVAEARAVPKDWPPYQAAVNQGMTFLELEAKPNLGVDQALVDRLITSRDVAILAATSNKVLDEIATLHGHEVEMAYRLGTNVAKLKIMCELGRMTSDTFGSSNGMYRPTRGDIFWSTDYVMHRATVCGLPPEIKGEVKEIRRLFDEQSNGFYQGGWALEHAYGQMQAKMDALFERHFSSLEAATALFAQAHAPSDPPVFPCRDKAVDDLITELEKWNGWLLFDVERWDRPPISLAFRFDGDGLQPLFVRLDPLVENIVKLPQLQRLGVSDFELTDQHLAKLCELQELRDLWLWSKAITPAGLSHLAELPRLEELWIYDDSASSDRIAPLAACPRLKELGFTNAQLGDAACGSLAKIKTLEKLYLGGSAITDDGVQQLKTLDKLTKLDLGATKLTDLSAPHLAELTNLEHLDVRKTGMTDEALPHLKKLNKLKVLDVSGSEITVEGTTELKQALPMCEVSGN